ncbi:phage tail tape measure protein [Candidatus Dependentiae bacterium]|nr:phage tail tape measure protein [Candidatus Dependentiae bacterium]
MFNLGTAVVKTAMDLAGITQGIQGAEGVFARAGAGLTRTGTALTMGLTMPIVAAGVAALNTAIDFDSAMMGVNSVLKLPAESFANLRDQVLEFSTTTSQSSRDVALALRDIVSSGFEAEDAMDILRISVDAAGNMMTDTETTTRALTATLRAYGMEATDVTHIADVLQIANNKSSVEFAELTANIGDALGMAAAANVPFETLTAAIMTTTDAGYSVAESSTAVRSLIQEMLNPTEDLAALMGEWGYETGEAALAGLGFQGVMEKLGEATGGSAAEISRLLGNVRANKAAFALTGEEGAAFAASLEEVGMASEGAGEHAAMADIRHQSWAYHIAKLKSEVEVFAIRLTSLLAPSIIEVVDVLKDWFTKLAQASPETLKFIAIVAGIAAAAGPVLIILGAIVSAIGALGVAFLPIVAVIAVVAIGIGLLVANFDTVKTAVQRVIAVVAELPGILAGLLGEDRIAALTEGFASFAAGVTGTFEVVRAWVVTHWPEIQAVIMKVMTVIQNIVNAVVSAVVPFVVDMFQKVVDWFNANWPLIQATVEAVLDAIWTVIQIVIGAIETFWSAHGEKIVRVASLVWDNVKTYVEMALNNLLGIIKAVMQMITGDWEGAWETIKEIVAGIWDAVLQIIQNNWNMILALFSTSLGDLKEKVSAIWENIVTGVTEWVENLKTSITEKIEEIKETWQTIWDSIVLIVTTIWENIVTSVSEWVENLKTSITEKIEGIKEALQTIWEDIKATVLEKLRSLFESMGLDFDEMVVRWTAIWEDVVLIVTDVWNRIVTGVSEWIENLRISITEKINIIKTFWSEKWDEISTKLSEIWTAIVTAVTEQVTAVHTAISGKITEVVTFWSTQWDAISTKLSEIWTAIVTAVTEKVQEIYNKIKDKIEEIRRWIGDQVGRFKSVGGAIINGLKDGVLGAVGSLISAVTSAIERAIAAAKNALQSRSPSRVFMKLGAFSGEGFEIGIMRSLDHAAGMVGNAFGDLTGGLGGVEGAFALPGTLSPVSAVAGPSITVLGDVTLKDVQEPADLIRGLQEYVNSA